MRSVACHSREFLRTPSQPLSKINPMSRLLTSLIAGSLAIATLSVNIPVKAQTTRFEQLRADLQTAVCLNNWDEATSLSTQIIGLSEITAEYRQEMMAYRHRLIDWRASRSVFENIPGCEGVILANQVEEPEPTMISPIDWEAAIRYGARNQPTGENVDPFFHGESGGYGSGRYSSASSDSSGNCRFPSDIAADGSRCGGRAASER